MKCFGKLSEIDINKIFSLIYLLIKLGYIDQERKYMPKIKLTLKVRFLNQIDNNLLVEMQNILNNDNQNLF